MIKNPWYVDSIQSFLCLKCPECFYYSKEKAEFQEHALDNHPLSFVLFRKIFEEDENNSLLNFEELKTDIAENGIGKENLNEIPLKNSESVISIHNDFILEENKTTKVDSELPALEDLENKNTKKRRKLKIRVWSFKDFIL